MICEDYATAEDRLNPKPINIHELMRGIRARLVQRMDARREELRARGRLIIDPACTWRPTSAAQTDLRATVQAERERLAAEQAKAKKAKAARPEPIRQARAKAKREARA